MQAVRKVFSRFGFAQLGSGIAIALLSLPMIPLAKPENLQKLMDTVGPSVLVLLTYVPNFVFLLLFWLFIRTVPKTEWQKENMSFGALLKTFVMMYALATTLNAIGSVVSRAAPAGGTEQLDLIDSIVNTRLLMGFLIPALFGPIVEELIFRKLMIDRLHQYGETTVIVFTALCFGLFHGNLTQFLYATCVGLFLGYVYCRTGKVIYTMIMHILLNTLSSSVMLLLPMLQGDQENTKIIFFVAVGILFLLMAVMFVAGYILTIRHLKKKDIVLDDATPEAIPRGEVFRTVYLSPGVALLFVYSIVMIVLGLLNIELPL